MTAMDAKYEYEYLIKYKNLSYLHIQWLSGSEIGTLLLQLFFPSASDNLIMYYMFIFFFVNRGDEPEEQGGAEPLPHQSGQGRAPGRGHRT